MFISFEGVNGAGKSTQIEMLRNSLQKKGYNVIVTREPGGTGIAEKIRQFLMDNPGLDKVTELLLIFAARNEHFRNLIQPTLENSQNIVLCDRFYDSSLVFQGALNGIKISTIMKLKDIVLGDFEPDLTIILDVDYRTAVYRMSQREITKDKYDGLDENKFNLIRKTYLKLADLFFDRCIVIKQCKDMFETAERILQTVMSVKSKLI